MNGVHFVLSTAFFRLLFLFNDFFLTVFFCSVVLIFWAFFLLFFSAKSTALVKPIVAPKKTAESSSESDSEDEKPKAAKQNSSKFGIFFFEGLFWRGLFLSWMFFFKQLLQISLPRWNPRRLSWPTNWRGRRRNPLVTPAIRRMRRKFPLWNLLQVCAVKFLSLLWNELEMWKNGRMEKWCYEFCVTGLLIKMCHFEWNEIWIWNEGR